MYWPAAYDGPVYYQVTPAQLKGWTTLWSTAHGVPAPPANGPTVLSQDGHEIGHAAEIVLDGTGHGLKSVRFMPRDGLWSDGLAEVDATCIARRDPWQVSPAFDFQTIRLLIQR